MSLSTVSFIGVKRLIALTGDAFCGLKELGKKTQNCMLYDGIIDRQRKRVVKGAFLGKRSARGMH